MTLFTSTYSGDMERAKLLWTAAALAFDAATISSLVSSFLVLRRFGGLNRQRSGWAVASVICGLAALRVSLLYIDIETPLGDSALEWLRRAVPQVRHLLVANNSFAWLAGLLMVVSSFFLTRRSERCEAPELGSRMRHLQGAIFAASALLVTGVAEIHLLYRWAGVAASEAGVSKAHPLFASVSLLPVAASVAFSMLLVVTFLPTAIVLDARLRSLMATAAQSAPDFSPEVWRLKNAVGESPLGVFSSYVALLAPVIAGLLTKIVDLVL